MTKWAELQRLHDVNKSRHILELFDKSRAGDFAIKADGMLFDYSKTNIDAGTRAALVTLADVSGVAEKRAAMFGGAKINDTEGRAVLHVALRAGDDEAITVDGKDVLPEVRRIRGTCAAFARDVRSGAFKGQGGKITDVVNIGIGGSDLGPAMAYLALQPFADGPRCHFVSNVDGAHIHDTLRGLNPETTLVIVASKTFTTIATAGDKTAAYGIDPARVFGFEDWVGGRYSMWGPIGLSLMIAIGPEAFDQFLAGGRAMDQHFLTAPFGQNMPVMLALVGVWHNQMCGYATRAVLPYDQRLSRLPAYLQQLEMESNGKRVAIDGSDLTTHSGPVVWGEPGTNGQHAFYQLIHQGTRVIPCEFLVARRGHEPDLARQHLLLVSNCLAQAEALLRGRSLDEAREIMAKKGATGAELERQARHRVFPGNRPSTVLAYEQLTPFVLGQIIALYEHRVFVEGVILGLNSYDQWGVELGKELALALQPVLEGKAGTDSKDGSTAALVEFLR
ncbi:MAG: glucose-6-phosphate isomerase [Rhodobacteraceae bacterium]|nr:MAG: glucose-6-phosphate isomerase [Paracoccaceae bacterium]